MFSAPAMTKLNVGLSVQITMHLKKLFPGFLGRLQQEHARDGTGPRPFSTHTASRRTYKSAP
jgi:hypothetical protein